MGTFKDGIKKSIDFINSDHDNKEDFSGLLRDTSALVTAATALASSSKLNKSIVAASIVVSTYSVVRGFKDLYVRGNRPKTFDLKIDGNDSLYNIGMEWIMESYHVSARDTVVAQAYINDSGRRSSARRDEGSVRVNTTVDGSFQHYLEFDGRRVRVISSSSEPQNGQVDASGMMALGGKSKIGPSKSLIFTCESTEDRDAVLEELVNRAKILATIPAGFHKSSRWGGFNRSSNVKPRDFSSVFLKEGQTEAIIDHIRLFLDNEEAYTKVGIPYRTGVMLYGPPGSGKSSTATAIANEFNIDIYYISLSNIDDDEALQDCFNAVPPRSVLILEDIDVVSAVKDRDKDNEKGITMSGMLNVLDGMISNHGVITIMTTNRLESIDPAIVRPGRIDLRMELGNLDMYQLTNLCKYFIGHVPEDLPLVVPEDGITSADLVGVFKSHVPDFANAESDIVKFIKDKINTKELVS